MQKITHYSSEQTPWGKSFTPKRYISPPMSENLITMWPSTMVCIGEIQGGMDSQAYSTGKIAESVLPSSAILFLCRERVPEYKKAEYKTRPDGIPIHTVVHKIGKAELEEESFCNSDRVSTVFTRLTVKNISDTPTRETITLVSRTGPEFDLLGICEPDGYTEAEPSLHRIKCLERWEHKQGYMTDGTYSVYYKASENATVTDSDAFENNFTDKDGIYFTFTLAPCECATIDVAFGRNKIDADFVYEEEKEKTIAFWEKEFSAIENFPNKNDPFTFSMVRSLVAQGLQMFNFPKDCDYVLMRQGSLQRKMWPTENRSMLEAFSVLGDFSKYHDAIFNTYFNVMQDESGQIVNFGIHWASITGCVLHSFSVAAKKHKDLYLKYKDGAHKAFLWIEAQRQKATDDPAQTSGIFPADQVSDYPGVFQAWTNTDMWNLFAYEAYADALESFDDENAKCARMAAENYRARLKEIYDGFAKEQENCKYIKLPEDPKNDPELESFFAKTHPHDGQFGSFIFLFSGLAGYGTDEAEKIIGYFTDVVKIEQNGLLLPHNEVNITSNGIQWYLNWLEYKMYFYYMRSGKKEIAKKYLQSQIEYSMTNEFYMSERYDHEDAFFTPWCPNCSASGRTLIMLADWYGRGFENL